MKNIKAILCVLCITFIFSGCKDESNETFDNKVFLKTSSKVNELLLKGSTSEFQKSIQAAIAQPETEEIKITYKVSPELVATYNMAYQDEAVMLPKENYEFATTTASILPGSVLSEEVPLILKDLNKLNRDTVFVLPVTIAEANLTLLESAKTQYYVIKAGALINVVADIEENYLTIDWKNPQVVNDLSQLTMEALIRARNYDRLISTVMGIEGQFLIRIGDAGFPENQIQIATNNGNYPEADSKKGLPTNEWIHIALTYDATANGALTLYVNGKKQFEDNANLGTISLGQGGTNGFCIGRSYADDRFLAGEISECRIWNVVRTKEEIVNNPYSVDPTSPGLVSYWKFDDEQSLKVKDHTGNENHAIANKALKWNSVSLPAAE